MTIGQGEELMTCHLFSALLMWKDVHAIILAENGPLKECKSQNNYG